MPQILVVDDDPGIRQFVSDVLDMEGYGVRTAPDGLTAVREYRTLRPDCILLDVMMPGLDGYGVLAQIRSDEGDFVPVIMLTAAADAGAANRAWAGGVDYFLPKPFVADQVLSLLDALFSNAADSPY